MNQKKNRFRYSKKTKKKNYATRLNLISLCNLALELESLMKQHKNSHRLLTNSVLRFYQHCSIIRFFEFISILFSYFILLFFFFSFCHVFLIRFPFSFLIKYFKWICFHWFLIIFFWIFRLCNFCSMIVYLEIHLIYFSCEFQFYCLWFLCVCNFFSQLFDPIPISMIFFSCAFRIKMRLMWIICWLEYVWVQWRSYCHCLIQTIPKNTKPVALCVRFPCYMTYAFKYIPLIDSNCVCVGNRWKITTFFEPMPHPIHRFLHTEFS